MNLRDQNYLRSLVLEFAAMPSETGWLEFKENKAEPQDIGEYISALANCHDPVGSPWMMEDTAGVRASTGRGRSIL